MPENTQPSRNSKALSCIGVALPKPSDQIGSIGLRPLRSTGAVGELPQCFGAISASRSRTR